jgi:hypothetical protein
MQTIPTAPKQYRLVLPTPVLEVVPVIKTSLSIPDFLDSSTCGD